MDYFSLGYDFNAELDAELYEEELMYYTELEELERKEKATTYTEVA